ncbi:MAG TPA: type II secretion system protein GspM [Longimicrobium sp.]
MSRISITPRDRKAITVGAAILVPGLIWAFAVSPYLHALRSAESKLGDERRLLRRELELLAEARGYPAAFADGAKKLLAVAPRLTGGDDDAAAGAAVAGYVRRLAQMGGANVTRVDPAPVRDAGGGITALPVAVTGEADLEGVMNLLQLLETGPKLVRVDELKIEAQDGPVAAGAAYAPTPFFVAAGGGSEVIRFSFTATGYTLATGKPVPAADSAEAGR